MGFQKLPQCLGPRPPEGRQEGWDTLYNTMKSIETPEKEMKTKTLKESKLHKCLTAGHPHICPKKNKTNKTDKLLQLNLTPPS